MPPDRREGGIEPCRPPHIWGFCQDKQFWAPMLSEAVAPDALPPSTWQPFFALLCDDIAAEQGRLGGHFAVAHSVYTRAQRDFIRGRIGPSLRIVALHMSRELNGRRIRER